MGGEAGSGGATRLTRTGQVFVVCAFFALLVSWNSGVNLYYLVFAAIASFILFSFILSRRNLLKLELDIEAPHAVHRHQSFTTLIRIRNLRRLLPVSSIRIEMASAPGVSQGFVLGIPARRVAQVRVTQLFERRGVALTWCFLIIFYSFILNLLAAFWPTAQKISFTGFLHYYAPLRVVLGEAVPWGDMGVLLALAVTWWTVGLVVFCRRDIHVT